MVRWDGNSFTELDSFDGWALGIAATSPNDVWLSSCRSCASSMFQGELRHYDGVGWKQRIPQLDHQEPGGCSGSRRFLRWL